MSVIFEEIEELYCCLAINDLNGDPEQTKLLLEMIDENYDDLEEMEQHQVFIMQEIIKDEQEKPNE